MRVFAVLVHYFHDRPDPIARLAALQASIVALHRHFGPRRFGARPGQALPEDAVGPIRRLDIAILTMRGRNLLDGLGLDSGLFSVEYADGDPLLLGFHARRLLQARAGGYDHYAVLEDDHVLHDPLFFAKLAWFEERFGSSRMLIPRRTETAQSGSVATVTPFPIIPSDQLWAFGIRRPDQAETLSGVWHGVEQRFRLPENPHSGCCFLTQAQLGRWLAAPTFGDRDTSFVGPLESAMTLSIGRSFDLYWPAAPDPFFLAVEHFGTRYLRLAADGDGRTYGDAPLLEALQAGGGPELDALRKRSEAGMAAVIAARDRAVHELNALRRSRSGLAKALARAILGKARRAR